MKKNTFLSFSFLFILGILAISSCKKDEVPEEPEEFIATETTFTPWANWTLEASLDADDPALNGFAHGVAAGSTRDIYIKDSQDPVEGTFPVGTLIFKHVKLPDGSFAYMAMAKRGNDFNPSYGDWEFFILNEDGSIGTDNMGNIGRGASVNGGGCQNCHTGAGTDFVFSK